jgi:hypothetical protein
MMRRWQRWALILLVAGGLGLAPGCDRSPSPPPETAPAAEESAPASPPPAPPQYSFAESDREDHPEIVAFLRHFLETCLAGDYAGYRRLSSRRREPESRERFEAVYHAIEALDVRAIEPVEVPLLTDRAYKVTCEVRFRPESQVRLRRQADQIAILVIREEEQWRILPAPARMQPQPEEAPSSSSGPVTTTAPSYPWDEDGDF